MPSPGLEARLQRARYAIERLRRAARTPWEDYITNRDLQDIVERNLHILLEAILDLAAFIASRRGLVRAATYKGLMEALVENNIIPREMAGLARSVAGMRNILVHGYAEIRHDIIYDTIREDLDSLEKLLACLAKEAEKLDP